jgi:hypothetical protein
MSSESLYSGGARVALVQMRGDPSRFGVAMLGGLYVCALPEGYDGRTAVFWESGWIGVFHPELPPLLADTTTGRVEPMNEQAAIAFRSNYTVPAWNMRLH